MIAVPFAVNLLLKFKSFDIVNTQHSIEDKYFETFIVFKNSYDEISKSLNVEDKLINYDESFIDKKNTEITLRFDSLNELNLFKKNLESIKNLNVANISVNKRG